MLILAFVNLIFSLIIIFYIRKIEKNTANSEKLFQDMKMYHTILSEIIAEYRGKKTLTPDVRANTQENVTPKPKRTRSEEVRKKISESLLITNAKKKAARLEQPLTLSQPSEDPNIFKHRNSQM